MRDCRQSVLRKARAAIRTNERYARDTRGSNIYVFSQVVLKIGTVMTLVVIERSIAVVLVFLACADTVLSRRPQSTNVTRHDCPDERDDGSNANKPSHGEQDPCPDSLASVEIFVSSFQPTLDDAAPP